MSAAGGPSETAPAGDGPAPPQAPALAVRRFSFACFPAERVAILACMVAGPGIAFTLLQQLALASGREDASILETMAHSTANARLFAGTALLLALVAVVYGALTLQWRAGTRLEVDGNGFSWRRRPVLPGGLLGGRVERPWPDVERVALEERRSLSGRRVQLHLTWRGGGLRLSVPDAWPEDGGKRPWLPNRPRSPRGWADHPLVLAVEAARRPVPETRPESPASETT